MSSPRAEIPAGPIRSMGKGGDWIWLSNWGTIFETDPRTLKSTELTRVSNSSDLFDFDAKTQTAYFGSGTSIYSWRLGARSKRRVSSSGDDWSDIEIRLSPAGDFLAAAQYSVSLYSLGTGIRRFRLHGPGDTWQTFPLSFSPGGRQLAAGTNSGYLEIWSTRTHKLTMATKPGLAIRGLHWFGDRLQVATFKYWRLRQRGPNFIAIYEPPNPRAIAVAWVPDLAVEAIDWLSPTSLIVLTEEGTIYSITVPVDQKVKGGGRDPAR